jgi:hypothetical protein
MVSQRSESMSIDIPDWFLVGWTLNKPSHQQKNKLSLHSICILLLLIHWNRYFQLVVHYYFSLKFELFWPFIDSKCSSWQKEDERRVLALLTAPYLSWTYETMRIKGNATAIPYFFYYANWVSINRKFNQSQNTVDAWHPMPLLSICVCNILLLIGFTCLLFTYCWRENRYGRATRRLQVSSCHR